MRCCALTSSTHPTRGVITAFARLGGSLAKSSAGWYPGGVPRAPGCTLPHLGGTLDDARSHAGWHLCSWHHFSRLVDAVQLSGGHPTQEQAQWRASPWVLRMTVGGHPITFNLLTQRLDRQVGHLDAIDGVTTQAGDNPPQHKDAAQTGGTQPNVTQPPETQQPPQAEPEPTTGPAPSLTQSGVPAGSTQAAAQAVQTGQQDLSGVSANAGAGSTTEDAAPRRLTAPMGVPPTAAVRPALLRDAGPPKEPPRRRTQTRRAVRGVAPHPAGRSAAPACGESPGHCDARWGGHQPGGWRRRNGASRSSSEETQASIEYQAPGGTPQTNAGLNVNVSDPQGDVPMPQAMDGDAPDTFTCPVCLKTVLSADATTHVPACADDLPIVS